MKSESTLGMSWSAALSLFAVIGSAAASCKCPSTGVIDSLAKLNATTNGRVQINTPFALPCFDQYMGSTQWHDAAACDAAQRNWKSLAYRAEVPGSYMYTQDSACASDVSDQCLLDSADPKNPAAYSNQTCRQGSVPTHYLEVRNPCDVTAAFHYSEMSGQPLVVKNSGHDTMAHSSRKGALSLWTRPLRKIRHDAEFVPEGAPSDGSEHKYMAMTIGAGVNCGEAYDYAQKNNLTVLCGYTPTVGMSGGWVQNGGHSVLSPAYGLGIDRVLQYKVVTPDGVYRTANEYQNQDLFWALRGGGGGTFGVVLESTHKVDPAAPVASIMMGFKTSNFSDELGFYEKLIEQTEALADLGWGGHVTGTTAVYINPLLSLDEAIKSIEPLSSYVRSRGGHVDAEQMVSFSVWKDAVLTKGNATAGSAGFVASRLIPRTTFQSEQGRKDLLAIIKDYVQSGGKFSLPIGPPTVFKQPIKNATSATPAWYSSLWHLTLRTGWAWNATAEDRRKTVAKLKSFDAQMERLAPESGAYMNEASPWTDDWQDAWWGKENYAALLAIKKRYDPKRLLLCWKCVGWEESDASSDCFGGLA